MSQKAFIILSLGKLNQVCDFISCQSQWLRSIKLRTDANRLQEKKSESLLYVD